MLKLILDDPDTAVRQDAIRCELLERLVILRASSYTQYLSFIVPSLKTQAIMALGKIGDPQALPTLTNIIKGLVSKDYEGRMAACEDNLYQEDLPPVEAAVKALAQIGDERAIPTLQQALKSTLIRVEAADALTRFGKTAVSPLVAMYKAETDDNIRFHVKETLVRLGWRPGQIRL